LGFDGSTVVEGCANIAETRQRAIGGDARHAQQNKRTAEQRGQDDDAITPLVFPRTRLS